LHFFASVPDLDVKLVTDGIALTVMALDMVMALAMAPATDTVLATVTAPAMVTAVDTDLVMAFTRGALISSRCT